MSTFPRPNYTQTPNTFFDDLLAAIDSLSELKVTLAIIRATFGWQQAEAELTLTDLEKRTGLTRSSVNTGLKAAMKRGTISRRKVSKSYAYKLIVESPQESNPYTDKSLNSIPVSVQTLDQSEGDIKEKKEKERKEIPAAPEVDDQKLDTKPETPTPKPKKPKPRDLLWETVLLENFGVTYTPNAKIPTTVTGPVNKTCAALRKLDPPPTDQEYARFMGWWKANKRDRLGQPLELRSYSKIPLRFLEWRERQGETTPQYNGPIIKRLYDPADLQPVNEKPAA